MNTEETWLLQEKYTGVQTPEFHEDLMRLHNGEPLAYIIGTIPFLNARISLDSHPLIPRVETEYWVEQLIATYTQSHTSPLRILDLCAGSGCIGVALGMAFQSAHITFAEIDEAHHATITKNAEQNGVESENYRVVGGDLFACVDAQQYDLIVSNPPYIDATLNRTQESVIQHEPALALYGGSKGMEIVKRILQGLPIHMTKDGIAYIEHEPEQTEPLSLLAKELSLSLYTHTDQYKVSRYSTIRMAQ